MSTSNIALQTFLELQILKSMINNTKIELWQEGTSYDANKPVRYDSKLYICSLAHVAGATFDPSKFEVLESSSGVNPQDIAFSDENFTATDVKAALIELFTNVSNGKTTIASAITDKGQTASGSNTFAQLATAISAIQTGGGAITKETRLNITAPYTKTIVLTNARDIEDLCTSIMEYVEGSTFTQYTCPFDNGDASSFNYSSSYVTFDGLMKLKTSYDFAMTNQGALGAGTLYESASITMTNFNYINSLSADETNTVVVGVPTGQVIKATGNIDLTGIARLDGIDLTSTVTGGGKVRIAVSVDSGTTWKTYYNSAWATFNPDNKADFSSYGMTPSTLNELTFSQLETLRGEATTIRFAYYLERSVYSDDASTDVISLDVLMPGASQICPTNKYTLSYNEGTKTITYEMTSSGTFTYVYYDA